MGWGGLALKRWPDVMTQYVADGIPSRTRAISRSCVHTVKDIDGPLIHEYGRAAPSIKGTAASQREGGATGEPIDCSRVPRLDECGIPRMT